MRRLRVVAVARMCARANQECSMTRTSFTPGPKKGSRAARTCGGGVARRPMPQMLVDSAQMEIFTIGHSTHPIERFVALLAGQGVRVLADVRSTPFSRFNPQFNRERLAKSLADAGIRYEFMGDALGARSTDPACFENGRVSYARLAESAAFRRGIEQLIEAARAQRMAIMC